MVHDLTLDDVSLIVVEVPQGRDAPYVFEGGVWLRENGETLPAGIDALRRLLRVKAETPLRWERRASTSMSMEDLDTAEIFATARESDRRLGTALAEINDEREILSALSLLESGRGFTNAADVLFSTNPSRRQPQSRAHLVVYAGDKSSDTFVDNRWFDGPAVRICREMISAVNALNSVRSSFRTDTEQREDLPAYDVNAIREAVVNAFVHRDYSAYSGGLRVSVYQTRIEIWNSGHLPEGLTPGALRDAHDSVVTNPDIASVFNIHGLIERVGRGTQYIVTASRRLGAATPSWQDTATGVTLRIYSAHAAPDRTSLNERQNWIISHLETGEVLSLQEITQAFEKSGIEGSARSLRRDVENLVDRALLVREGRSRTTRYRLREL
jgi:ATP-dependent DNA helicase RecG